MLMLGRLLSKPFAEQLRVREGAVESPHAFNMYVDPLRQRIESLHPRLCKLLHVTIALVLYAYYADDAALPADSVEDLQLVAQIFEQFCNEMCLFRAVPKTYLTVFHADSDGGVVYLGAKVFVDCQGVAVWIYGEKVSATQTFKYLGVVLESSGSNSAHLSPRAVAFQRASGMLRAGLGRLPGFSHSFMAYL